MELNGTDMLFTSSRSKYKSTKLNVNLCNQRIEHVDSIKYLGLILDPNLSFKLHINNLCGKLNSRSKLLWRLRGFIDFNLAKMLYISLIHPHILYCNFIIDGACVTEKKKLQVQQNSALRAVCKVDYSYPTIKLLTDVGIDSVQTCMAKTSCKIAFRGLINQGPPALNNMFKLYEPKRMLRSSSAHQIEISRCYTQFGTKNVAIRGAKYLNMLPIDLRLCNSIENFKAKLKTYTGFD